MATINPYLNYPGTAEEAFTFYKSILGGEFATVQRFKDTVPADKLNPAIADKMMHISLPIGNNILMATDAMEEMGHPFIPGNNFHLSLDAESEADAERLFNGLSAGGEVLSPLKKEFWGAYFGMWKDKFGIMWMVNYDYNKEK